MFLTMFLAATASNLAAPNFERLLSPNDYPRWAIDQEVSAAGLVSMSVDASGKVTGCETISTMGFARLGRAICPIVIGRRAIPARDSAGNAVPSRATTLLRMFLWPNNAIKNAERSADFTLPVQRLPDGSPTASVEVVLEVEPTGTVTNCAANSSAFKEALVKAACASFQSSILDEKSSVRFVTTRKVQFTTETPQPDNSAAHPR